VKTLDDLTLRQDEKEAVREATSVLKANFPVEEVILFGSKARGEDDEESEDHNYKEKLIEYWIEQINFVLFVSFVT